MEGGQFGGGLSVAAAQCHGGVIVAPASRRRFSAVDRQGKIAGETPALQEPLFNWRARAKSGRGQLAPAKPSHVSHEAGQGEGLIGASCARPVG